MLPFPSIAVLVMESPLDPPKNVDHTRSVPDAFNLVT